MTSRKLRASPESEQNHAPGVRSKAAVGLPRSDHGEPAIKPCFPPQKTLWAVTASLLANAVEMLGSAQIESSIIDSTAGQRALTQFVAGQ